MKSVIPYSDINFQTKDYENDQEQSTLKEKTSCADLCFSAFTYFRENLPLSQILLQRWAKAAMLVPDAPHLTRVDWNNDRHLINASLM